MPPELKESELHLMEESLGSDVDAEGDEEDFEVETSVRNQLHGSEGEDNVASHESEDFQSPEATSAPEMGDVVSPSASNTAPSESGTSELESGVGKEESDEEYTADVQQHSHSVQSEEEAEEEDDSRSSSALYEDEKLANGVSEASDSSAVSVADESESEEAVASESFGEEVENHSDFEADPNSCFYCQYGEEDGPGPDTETPVYLGCRGCNNNAHQFCAMANGFQKDQDTWRCPKCVKNESRISDSGMDSTLVKTTRPRGSSSRILKDLLPVSRGVQKPGQHSVFAQLLLAEEDGNGPNLRKRKSPTGELSPVAEKRRRKATPKAASAERAITADAEQVHPSSTTEEAAGDTIVTTQSSRMSSRPARRASQRQPVQIAPSATIEKRSRDKSQRRTLTLKFTLDRSRLDAILKKPPQPKPHRKPARKLLVPTHGLQMQSHRFPCLPTRSLIFPSVPQNHRDVAALSHTKPYSGTLQPEDSTTINTTSLRETRDLFEKARLQAEEDRRLASLELDGDRTDTPVPPSSRPNKKNSNPASKIEKVQFGKYVIDTFYSAPYPEEFSHERRLFICEFCLKYLPSQFVAFRHKLKCSAKHPPGDQIYVNGSVSVWEVDGRKKTEYCQCLCLMAKMFLGSKTLYYDVEPFLFYILTESDDDGHHFVGYFSKEKRPTSLNNVSCILVMPIHQRKGYATFLIDFSYLLTRIEGKEGSPEKPLSDMGLTAYRAYWDLTVSKCLLKNGTAACSVRNLMKLTGMTADDVMHTLERLYALVRDPITGNYAIRYDDQLYGKLVEDDKRRGNVKLHEDLLQWTPYLMGRSDVAHLESAPMQTVAPREDQESDLEDMGSPPKATYLAEDGDQQGEALADAREDQEDTEEPDGQELTNGLGSSHEVITPLENLTNGVEHSRDSAASTPAHPSSSPVRPPPNQNSLSDENIHAPSLMRSTPVPGPPPTSVLDTAVNYAVLQSPSHADNIAAPLVNGDHSTEPLNHTDSDSKMEVSQQMHDGLSGYALDHAKHEIPPLRYQIVPPIPTSVINAFNRTRSNRRRTGPGGFRARGLPSALSTPLSGGAVVPDSLLPVRSSPRYRDGGASGAKTPNGSIGPPGSVTGSLRRGRSSGLQLQIDTNGKNETIDNEDDGEVEEESVTGDSGGDGSEEEGDENENSPADDESDAEADDGEGESDGDDEDEESSEDSDDDSQRAQNAKRLVKAGRTNGANHTTSTDTDVDDDDTPLAKPKPKKHAYEEEDEG
ncbi:MAG: hypothetical protein Q9227_008438 [Pyrenula ochraceoflavens]